MIVASLDSSPVRGITRNLRGETEYITNKTNMDFSPGGGLPIKFVATYQPSSYWLVTEFKKFSHMMVDFQ